MTDNYNSMEELFTREPRAHYKLTTRSKPNSRVFVVSPHGGSIEYLTSEIADTVAGDLFKYHDFAGRLPESNFAKLHVTSRNYDCLLVERLNAESLYTLAIHGCTGKPGEKVTYLGGKDQVGRELVRRHLEAAGFKTAEAPPHLSGLGDDNIVNLNQRGMGIQLEISYAQRRELAELRLATSDRFNLFNRYCSALREALGELSGECYGSEESAAVQ